MLTTKPPLDHKSMAVLLLTVLEVVARLGVSRAKVYNLVARANSARCVSADLAGFTSTSWIGSLPSSMTAGRRVPIRVTHACSSRDDGCPCRSTG